MKGKYAHIIAYAVLFFLVPCAVSCPTCLGRIEKNVRPFFNDEIQEEYKKFLERSLKYLTSSDQALIQEKKKTRDEGGTVRED